MYRSALHCFNPSLKSVVLVNNTTTREDALCVHAGQLCFLTELLLFKGFGAWFRDKWLQHKLKKRCSDEWFLCEFSSPVKMGNRLRLNEKQFSPTWLRAARPGIIDETWSHLVRDSATSILIMEDFRGCGSCGRLHRPEKNTQCIHIPWRHLSPELTVDLKRIKCLKWRSVLKLLINTQHASSQDDLYLRLAEL